MAQTSSGSGKHGLSQIEFDVDRDNSKAGLPSAKTIESGAVRDEIESDPSFKQRVFKSGRKTSNTSATAMPLGSPVSMSSRELSQPTEKGQKTAAAAQSVGGSAIRIVDTAAPSQNSAGKQEESQSPAVNDKTSP